MAITKNRQKKKQKKTQKITSGRIRNFVYCSWEYNRGKILWKTVWHLLKNENRTIIRASKFTPRYMPRRNENICSHTHTPVYEHSQQHYSLTDPTWEHPKMLIFG